MSTPKPYSFSHMSSYASAYGSSSSLSPHPAPVVASSTNWKKDSVGQTYLGSTSAGSKALQVGFVPKESKDPLSKTARDVSTVVMGIQGFFTDFSRGANDLPIPALDNSFMVINYPVPNAYHSPSQGETNAHFCFNPEYATCPEVVGHEYTHAVVHKMKPLNGYFESALDEALADLTGLAFVHSRNLYSSRPGDQFHWQLGFKTGKPIRDLNSTNHTKQFVALLSSKDEHQRSLLLSRPFCLAQQNLQRLGQDSEKHLLKAWWQAYQELDLSPRKTDPVEDFLAKVEEFKGLVFKYCSRNGNLGPEATRQCVVPAWKSLWDVPLQKASQK